MIHRRLPSLLLLATAVAVSACADMLNPDSFAEPAWIVFQNETAEVTLPDTVTRNTPFAVRIRTFGGGCVREVARTDVQVSGNTIEIRPYNERRNSGVCPDDLRRIDHVATVQVANAGTATIRVIGEQQTGGGDAPKVRAEVTRTIVVR